MISQEESIIRADSSHLRQALVTVEEELFAEVLQLLRFLCQHEAECLFFVLQEFVLATDQIVLGALEAPS